MSILIFILNLLYFGVLFITLLLILRFAFGLAAYFSFRENVSDSFFEPNYDYLDSDSNFERKLILTELRAISKDDSSALALNSIKDLPSNFEDYQIYLSKLTTFNRLDGFLINNEIDFKFLNLFEFLKLNKDLILIKDFTFLILFFIIIDYSFFYYY